MAEGSAAGEEAGDDEALPQHHQHHKQRQRQGGLVRRNVQAMQQRASGDGAGSNSSLPLLPTWVPGFGAPPPGLRATAMKPAAPPAAVLHKPGSAGAGSPWAPSAKPVGAAASSRAALKPVGKASSGPSTPTAAGAAAGQQQQPRQQQESKAAALSFVEQSLLRMQLQLQQIESSLVLGSKQQSSGLRRNPLFSDGAPPRLAFPAAGRQQDPQGRAGRHPALRRGGRACGLTLLRPLRSICCRWGAAGAGWPEGGLRRRNVWAGGQLQQQHPRRHQRGGQQPPAELQEQQRRRGEGGIRRGRWGAAGAGAGAAGLHRVAV